MDEMGKDAKALLKWITDVAEARNTDPTARTVNLKFSRNTLQMFQDRARAVLAE